MTKDQLSEIIISKSSLKKIPKSTLLIKEGDICDTFIFLKKGIVHHSFLDINGNEIIKNFIVGPTYFFYSLSSFISKDNSAIQCKTLTNVELYEMNLENFKELLKQKYFFNLWNDLLSYYIIKKEKKELSFMKDDALTRYKNFLLDFPGLLNKIPHYYIASYLSISPETLSRIKRKIS